MIKSFGKDPLKCPKCGEEMELWYIWHPRYGYIYDFARDAPGLMEELKESGYVVEKEEADWQQRQLSFWGQGYQTCLS